MSELLLPPGSRLIHIGPHKTGSTAIQVALQQARDAMVEHGVYYPTGPYRRRRAGWSLGLAGRPAGTTPPPVQLWENLVTEVADAGDVRVCVSNEDFGRATPEQARRIVNDLGGERAHVVAVVRRLDRYLPSQWQERIKAGDRRSFDSWLRVVLGGDESRWEHRNVWVAHDVEALVRRWLEVVDPERFTLIVSDDSDHSLIPRTFEALLGLPEDFLRPVSDRSNRSLNLVEAELVRQVNQVCAAQGVKGPLYRQLVRHGLTASLIQSPGAIPGGKIQLPDWALSQVRELSDQRAEAVARLGVRLVGDPDRLRVPAEVTSGDPDATGASVPLAATMQAVGETLRLALEQIAAAHDAHGA